MNKVKLIHNLPHTLHPIIYKIETNEYFSRVYIKDFDRMFSYTFHIPVIANGEAGAIECIRQAVSEAKVSEISHRSMVVY